MLPRKNVDIADQMPSGNEQRLAEMRSSFAQAAAAGCLSRRYLIAGFAIDVQIAGEQLADQVTRAFLHLDTVDTIQPALSIELWDEEATGVATEQEPPPGGAQILMTASADGRFVCEHRPQGVALLDRTRHRIVAHTRSAGSRYLDERARPFHRLMSTWLNDRGIQFMHGGLVSVQGSGILFAGQGGAGKSTSTIACLRAGFRYLGDDFIGIEHRTDGSFRGYGLFASCLLNLEHMQRFDDLTSLARRPYHASEDKAVFYMGELFPDTIIHQTEIRAILLPRIADCTESFTERASKAESLFALAPSSVMLLPSPTTTAFHVLTQLVDRCPSYRLYLGRDLDSIPRAVSRLATELEV
ncbi:serine kinase [soil metagenome]